MVENIIIIAVVAFIVTGILLYLRREKKKGVTCIGCPYAKECAKRKNGGCGTAKN